MAHVGVERLGPGHGQHDGAQRHESLPAGMAEQSQGVARIEGGHTGGYCTIWARPSSARVANQTSIIGPNSAPTRAVPRLWMRKTPSSTTAAIGTT